jgi:hypothetical protein
MNYIKENIIVTDPWHFSKMLEHVPYLSDTELNSRMMETVINKILQANGDVLIYLITEWQRPATYIFLFSYLSLQHPMIYLFPRWMLYFHYSSRRTFNVGHWLVLT